MDKQRRQAWVIASSLFVILFFVWGGTYNTTPLFVGAFLKSFGWSHAQVAWIPSIIALSVGITGPVAGWLLDRIEARNVMGTGAVLVALGLVMASRSNSFAELICANVILGVGLGHHIRREVLAVANIHLVSDNMSEDAGTRKAPQKTSE